MNTLNHKIDFAALVSVTMANSNGDPLNGNRPRTDYNGYGEMSDVCIKRKIRNRMQDLGNTIFVQSEDRCDDGFGSLSERASAVMKGITDRDEYAKKACETWLDVRTFGQVFAFKVQGAFRRRPRPGVRPSGGQRVASRDRVAADHQERQRRKEGQG